MSIKKKEILVALILDKSGSMGHLRRETISGVNEYLGTLRKDKKVDYKFSLTTFNHEVKTEKAVPLKEFKDLDDSSYVPDGMTALYDGVCITLKEIGKIAKKKQDVLVIIMTDGEENSSKEYKMEQMSDMIKDLEPKRYTFVFLGANQDSFAMARNMNINVSNVTNYSASSAGIKQVFSTLSTRTVSYAGEQLRGDGGGGAMTFFSKADQDLLNKTK